MLRYLSAWKLLLGVQVVAVLVIHSLLLLPRGVQAQSSYSDTQVLQDEEEEDAPPLSSLPLQQKVQQDIFGGDGGGSGGGPQQGIAQGLGLGLGLAASTTCPANNQTYLKTCIDSSMDIYTTGIGRGLAYIPPDPCGAVGHGSLIAVTNAYIEGLWKNGTTIFTSDLQTMFQAFTPTGLFDPRIVYDFQENRFVLVVLDKSPSSGTPVTDANLLLAVSKTATPYTATDEDWYFQRIPAFINNMYADFPALATDEEAIYITVNMYTPLDAYSTPLVFIVAKEPLYSWGEASDASYYDYLTLSGVPSLTKNTHIPAIVRNPRGIAPNVGTFLLCYSGARVDTVELIQIIQINNPLALGSSVPTFLASRVLVSDFDTGSLNKVPQPGTSITLDPNDRRILSAVWVNQQLWMVTTIKDLAGQTSAYWLKFWATGTNFPPTIMDHGAIDGEDIGPNTWTFYPSIDVNSQGVAVVGFSASSSTTTLYASAFAAVRDDLYDPAGTFRTPNLVKAGQAPYFLQFTGTRNRWGDYSSTALDPANEDCFWVFNQYAGAGNFTEDDGQFGEWKTAWAKLCHSSQPTVPPTLAPTPPPTPTPCLQYLAPCVYNATNEGCCAPFICRKAAKTDTIFNCRTCKSRGSYCWANNQCCTKNCKVVYINGIKQRNKQCR